MQAKVVFALKIAGENIQKHSLVIALVILTIWLGSVGLRLNQRIQEKEGAIKEQTEEVIQKQKEIEDLNKQLEEEKKRADARVSARVASATYVNDKKSYVSPNVNTGGAEQWRSLVSQYDWPVDQALTIMACESGGMPTKHNYNPSTKDNSWGLFQVNLWSRNALTRPAASELVKPEVSVAFAYRLWSGPKRFGHSGGWANCARRHGIY